jgi:hypothetical protein
MCRIAYFPGNSASIIGIKLLKTIFSDLSTSCGGDGNGIVAFHNNIPILARGVKTTIDTCANIAIKATQGCLFHTRLATTGSKCEDNSQPIPIDKKRFLAHNGIWNESTAKWSLLSAGVDPIKLIDMSDSVVAALCIKYWGSNVLHLIDSGIWVIAAANKLSINAYSGTFDTFKLNNELPQMFASEVPHTFISSSVETKKFETPSLATIKHDSLSFHLGGLKVFTPSLTKTYFISYKDNKVNPSWVDADQSEFNFWDTPPNHYKPTTAISKRDACELQPTMEFTDLDNGKHNDVKTYTPYNKEDDEGQEIFTNCLSCQEIFSFKGKQRYLCDKCNAVVDGDCKDADYKM